MIHVYVFLYYLPKCFIKFCLQQEFLLKAKTRVKKRSKMSTNTNVNADNSKSLSSSNKNTKQIETIRLRHAAILGLCAFIDAHPYDVPSYIPDIFSELGNHLNDPQPIPVSYFIFSILIYYLYPSVNLDNFLEYRVINNLKLFML